MTTQATTRLSDQRARAWSLRGGRARASGAGTGAVAAYLSVLQAESDPQTRLQHGVDLLPALVQGCHHASVAAVAGGRLEVLVATDPTSQRADELQDELDEGPHLQAVRTGHSVVAHGLRTETRWLAWCSAAVSETPVRSVLSVLLHSTMRPLATVNFYSDTVDGLSGVDIGLLDMLAGPLADALADVRAGAGRLGPAA